MRTKGEEMKQGEGTSGERKRGEIKERGGQEALNRKYHKEGQPITDKNRRAIRDQVLFIDG